MRRLNLLVLGSVAIIGILALVFLFTNQEITAMQSYGGYTEVKGTVSNREKCDSSKLLTTTAYLIDAFVGNTLVGSGEVKVDGTYRIMFQNLEDYLSLGESMTFLVNGVPCGDVYLNYLLLKATGHQIVYDMNCEWTVKCSSTSSMTVNTPQEPVNLPLPPGATKVLAQNIVGSFNLLVSKKNKPVSLSWVSPNFHWSHAANEKGAGSCGYGTSVPDGASLDWKIINSETGEVVMSKHIEGGDFKPDTGLYEPEESASIFIDDVEKGNYYWEINYVNINFSWCGIWVFK